MLILVETITRSAYWIYINITEPPEDKKDIKPPAKWKGHSSLFDWPQQNSNRKLQNPAKRALLPQTSAAVQFYGAQVKFERVLVQGKSRKTCANFSDFCLAKQHGTVSRWRCWIFWSVAFLVPRGEYESISLDIATRAKAEVKELSVVAMLNILLSIFYVVGFLS